MCRTVGCKPQQLSCTGNTICEYSLHGLNCAIREGYPLCLSARFVSAVRPKGQLGLVSFAVQNTIFGINSYKFGTFHRFIQGHDPNY